MSPLLPPTPLPLSLRSPWLCAVSAYAPPFLLPPLSQSPLSHHHPTVSPLSSLRECSLCRQCVVCVVCVDRCVWVIHCVPNAVSLSHHTPPHNPPSLSLCPPFSSLPLLFFTVSLLSPPLSFCPLNSRRLLCAGIVCGCDRAIVCVNPLFMHHP